MKKTVIVLDDDEVFASTLSRSLARRGYDAYAYFSLYSAEPHFASMPDFAVIDLKIDKENGLTALNKLLKVSPETKAVILTGYSSISTAVEAIKSGATNYLCKPANTDEVLSALNNESTEDENLAAAQPISVERLEWEHINRVLNEHHGNISATARALNMHRRTLQRKLLKRPVNR
ncbi:MAG: response regulator [Hahellaceae bacterium]|nr:response regulator [Hahellaceae bacterium]MCP5169831.1 response regulator [Hahellaceae bacterium]